LSLADFASALPSGWAVLLRVAPVIVYDSSGDWNEKKFVVRKQIFYREKIDFSWKNELYGF
jgi:hypothetical protein